MQSKVRGQICRNKKFVFLLLSIYRLRKKKSDFATKHLKCLVTILKIMLIGINKKTKEINVLRVSLCLNFIELLQIQYCT